MSRASRTLAFLTAVSLPVSIARADEGMWTFNNFPSAKVKAKYNFEPTKDWLDHLRLSSVRIAGGCSASVVSPDGLVMTNHHCARECIEGLSGLDKKDYNKDGFWAKAQTDEKRCPGYELNQLVEIADVTKKVQDATKDTPADKFNDVQKATIAGIEKEFGLVRTSLLLAIGVAASNLHQLLLWAKSTDDTRDEITQMDVTCHGFAEYDENGNLPDTSAPPDGR